MLDDRDGEFVVHGRIIAGPEADSLSLRDAMRAGHVVARCRCSHRESVATEAWRGSGDDAGLSLGILSRRLRCICGAKDLALEVWPLAPANQRGRVYHSRR